MVLPRSAFFVYLTTTLALVNDFELWLMKSRNNLANEAPLTMGCGLTPVYPGWCHCDKLRTAIRCKRDDGALMKCFAFNRSWHPLVKYHSYKTQLIRDL